jgi:hypothetical protein
MKEEFNYSKGLNPEIITFNKNLSGEDKEICELLSSIIDVELPDAESKIWHANPVWFLDGNPIVGYSKQKSGIRLMFWSGADFDEEVLSLKGKKFKDASVFYSHVSEIQINDLKQCLQKSRGILWDYKNIVKRKGHLERLI